LTKQVTNLLPLQLTSYQTARCSESDRRNVKSQTLYNEQPTVQFSYLSHCHLQCQQFNVTYCFIKKLKSYVKKKNLTY